MRLLKLFTLLCASGLTFHTAATAGGLNVLDHGVVGDGTTVNTDAIQSVIALCGKTGAGAVRFPQGRYLTGPLDIPDFVEIVLEDGAELILESDEQARWSEDDRALLRIRGQRGIVIRGGTLSVPRMGTAIHVEDSRQIRVIDLKISGQRGIHAQNVQRLRIEDVHIDVSELPPYLIMNSRHVELVNIASPSTSNEPIVSLHNCRDVLLRDTTAVRGNRTFVMVLGSGSEQIVLRNNDLSAASNPYLEGPDVLPGKVKVEEL